MRQIKLNALEMATASVMACMRQGMNDAANVTEGRRIVNPKGNGGSGFDHHFLGARGEVAFARAYNLCPDWSFEPRKGSPDFRCNGRTIDVKSTDREDGNLIQRPDANEKFDFYVLAVVRHDLVTIHGYATTAEMFDPSNLRILYPGGPPTHVIAREALHDPDVAP